MTKSPKFPHKPKFPKKFQKFPNTQNSHPKTQKTPQTPQNITQITIFPQNLPKNFRLTSPKSPKISTPQNQNPQKFRPKQKIPLVQQLYIIIYAKISPKTKFFPNSLKNTNSQKFKQSPKFCHTERSEVSTNSKCEFTYIKRGFFAFCESSK